MSQLYALFACSWRGKKQTIRVNGFSMGQYVRTPCVASFFSQYFVILRLGHEANTIWT